MGSLFNNWIWHRAAASLDFLRCPYRKSQPWRFQIENKDLMSWNQSKKSEFDRPWGDGHWGRTSVTVLIPTDLYREQLNG